MKQIFITGVIGGLMGLIISFSINFFLIPLPETVLTNASGNGISGLISGFMGGFIGLMMYLKNLNSRENKTLSK